MATEIERKLFEQIVEIKKLQSEEKKKKNQKMFMYHQFVIISNFEQATIA